MTGALVVAEGLSLATQAGPVFADLTFTVPRSRLSVVVGPSGSGRSALLLALSGRMRGLSGSLRLGQHAATTRPRDLRRRTAIARVATLVGPEGQLTVGESMVERALIDGVQASHADAAVAEAEQVLEVTFDRDVLVDQLPAYERSLLCVALSMVRPADLIVLDDADHSLDLAEQRRLLAALSRLSVTGRTVLTSTTEAAAVPADANVIALSRLRTAQPATPNEES
ncbi:ATP-binding cassette domain-containing protein [uncultured Friedmanniella sp.]|uniref:ATP-binding cassette domain-containing protein n=1 Tax=uncultured Friedmanniella sp. TaxID=335381 RepID=UPI0035CC6612